MPNFDTYDLSALRKEMAAQEKRKWLDPDLPRGAEHVPVVWVAYTWQRTSKKFPRGRWILEGFIRTKHLRLPKLARIRRNFKIEASQIMLLLELFHAQRIGGPKDPPTRFNPLVTPSKALT